MKLERSNKDPQYWERILESEGLTMDSGSFGLPEHRNAINEYFSEQQIDKMRDADVLKGFQITSSTDTNEQLRQKFDGADNFVAGGHAVRGAGQTSHSQRIARTPDWAHDTSKVKALLLAAFPKADRSPGHARRAGRWARVIQLYYRMGLTRGNVCQVLDITEKAFEMILMRIDKTFKTLQLA